MTTTERPVDLPTESSRNEKDRDPKASPPKAGEVRQNLQPHDGSNTVKGIAIFLATAAVYAGLIAGVLLVPAGWTKLLLAVAAGFANASLFVVGHDGCHGSLTRKRWLNQLVGRLAFLPNYHPYVAWEHSHNGLHHGWTNVKTKDPVFVPLSVDEYLALPAWRRALERFNRSVLGTGMMYIVQVWLPYEVLAPKANRPRGRKARTYQLDRLLVGVFFAAQCASAAWVATATGQSIALLISLAVIVPGVLFMWLMGWAIHLHHTHPYVPWYSDEDQWGFYQGQVRCTVHAEFPRIVDRFIHQIMDHTAHHSDPRIPLYELHNAQERIEGAYSIDVINQPFTFRHWLGIFRKCRLFDYQTHQWLDWDGTPTADTFLTRGE